MSDITLHGIAAELGEVKARLAKLEEALGIGSDPAEAVATIAIPAPEEPAKEA